MPPLVAAVCIVLCEALSFGLILPVMGFFNTELGGSAKFLGLLFALVSGPKIITNPVLGWTSDRIGRRPVLVLSTLGTIGGSLLWGLSGSCAMLALSRAVTGIFSTQAGIAQAVVADTTAREKRAASMALLGAAFGIALGLGPPIGGLVGKHWGYPAVGWVCAVLQASSLLVITFGLRETRGQRAASTPVEIRHAEAGPNANPASNLTSTSPVLPYARELRKDVFRNGLVWLLLAILVVVNCGMNGVFATLSPLVRDRFGFEAQQAGYAFGVLGLVALLVQGGAIRPMVRKVGERGTLLSGSVWLSVGLFLIGMDWGLPIFWSGLVISSVGVSLASPCLSALLSHAVSDDEQGIVSGMQQSGLAIGRTLGNLASGWAYDRIGTGSPAVSGAILSAVALLMTLAVPRRTAAHSSPTLAAEPATATQA